MGTGPGDENGVELLLFFAHLPDMTDFRIDELQSCAAIFNTKVELQGSLDRSTCFIKAKFESHDIARKICTRMVTLKCCLELWGEGLNYDETVKNAAQYYSQKGASFENSSFKFVFDAFGGKVSWDEKVRIFNRFADVGLKGDVVMKDPQELFWVIEDVGIHYDVKDGKTKVHERLTPDRIYFAREICCGGRKQIERYSLKTRKWIGTTSMIPDLCMLMANQVGVVKGSMVWDPFCGTGSTLISCSHFGAICFGSDLDGRALGTLENGIQANCKQYGFYPHDIMRMDLSQSCWNRHEILEGIVSDPPYGRRESRKKIDTEKQEKVESFVEALTEEQKSERLRSMLEHYIPPPKTEYTMQDLMTDLVDKAAKLLTVGGRLVYWHPTTTNYDPSELPRNPCLELLSDPGQSVTIRLKRRLVTMRKTRSWSPTDVTSPPTIAEGETDFHYKHEAHDSKEYLEYKAKRTTKKNASAEYREKHGIKLAPKMTKSERRKFQEAQIEKKRLKREEQKRQNEAASRDLKNRKE
eukprot:TRINITY_DN11738_c0_g1_i2.p1 TRINITY_DN11738_c0_g1~~TRINITY_DN11738_c0_g1_i2.p1  ORF type:complete len:546 (+),score=110.20 TRINITY_DN11738_c0_g1_i2:66-1640(+)